MEASTQTVGSNTKSSYLQRSGAPKHSPAHLAPASMSTTPERKTASPSHIPVPSRLSSPPPRALSAIRYTRVSPEKHMPPQSEPVPVHRSITRIPAPQARFSIHSSLHPPTPDSLCRESDTLPSVETRRAWEEKQPTSSFGKSGKFVHAKPLPELRNGGIHSAAKSPKKSVSFSSQLPSYKKTSSIPPLKNAKPISKNDASLPEVSVLKRQSGEGTDGSSERQAVVNSDSPLLAENALLRDQLTHTSATMSTLEETFILLKEEQQKMQRESEKAMHDMRERHRLELSRERQRLHNQILTLSGVHHEDRRDSDVTSSQQTQQRVGVLEEQLAEKTAECSNLQAELNAKKATAEREDSLGKNKVLLLQTQVQSLQSQLSLQRQQIEEMKAKEATYSSERRRLQHSMQSEKEGVKQQLMASMRELARTQELNSSLQQRISTLNKELTSSRKQLSKAQQSSAKTTTLQKSVKLSQQEIERLQKSVSSERQRYTTLEEKLLQIRTQLEESKRDICESSRELTELRQFKEKTQGEDSAARKFARGESVDSPSTAAAENGELKARNAMLSAELSAAQDIQSSLERKITLLEQTIQSHEQSSRKHAPDLEAQLRESQAALARCQAELSEMQDKCQSLETSLETTFSTQVRDGEISHLETEVYEAKLQLSELSDKLETEISASSNLKDDLDCSQQECQALHDQLQLQRESAALSLNRIQQRGYKKQKQLAQQLKELQKRVKEVQASEKEAKSECVRYMAELSHEKAQLEKLREANTLLSTELKEKEGELRLAEQQNHELSGRAEEEKSIKASIQTELSREVQAHLECSVVLSHHEEQLETLQTERNELQQCLAETQMLVQQQQESIDALQLNASRAKQQLSAAKHSVKQKEKEAQTRVELLRRDYQGQMLVLQSQLQELQSSTQTLTHNLHEKEIMLADLEAARETLLTEQRLLQARLGQSDREYAQEREKSSTLTAENSSLKAKLGHLQEKVAELMSAQREYEDYTQKLEQSTKSEMQYMLEEMSQHIQQQSDSQKYLEKLRAENERMTLQEKERQIQDLRRESAALQQRRKQEEVLVESLKFENQLMRAQLRGYSRRGQCEVATRRDVLFSSVSVTSGEKLPPVPQHPHSITHSDHMKAFNPYSFYR